jgi:drug/metabolite transporter (DMT)-like permease
MLITGSINTLATKLADVTSSEGIDGKSRDFNHPFFQALGMFMGELMCLPVFYFLKWRASKKLGEDQEPKKEWSPWIFCITASFDMTGTSLMYVGLNLTYASVYQMLRGSVVIFTGILSMLVFGRRLLPFQWLGMILVLFGLAFVGLSSVIGSGSNDSNAPDPVLGDIIIVAAQVVVAGQMVLQEKFISNNDVPPLQVVGLEGLFGFSLTSLLLLLFYFIPGNNGSGGHLEDTPDALVQMSNSWVVFVALVGNVISIAFFNWFGASVTKAINATTRMVLDSVRTFIIWGVSLAVGWQDFNYLQIIGFALLLAGTAIYNKIMIVPIAFFRPPVEDIPEALDKGIQDGYLDDPLLPDDHANGHK